MTKNDIDFDFWFDLLSMQLSDRGVNFRDQEAVAEDYEAGRDYHDVVDEIADEYSA